MKARILRENSHRDIRAEVIVKRLGAEESSNNPDLIIGTGASFSQSILEEKALKVATTMPEAHKDKFDIIITPSYEPHEAGDNIITTIGLVNSVNKEILEEKGGDKKIYAVLVGGKHAVGNITIEDANKLADIINGIEGASFLVTNCSRTEKRTFEALKEQIEGEFYDYKENRETENPYLKMLDKADGIIVTGDSVRMISESCSSGKPVFIYPPLDKPFQYEPLWKELKDGGFARILDKNNDFNFEPEKPLDEAGRVAEIIRKKLLK